MSDLLQQPIDINEQHLKMRIIPAFLSKEQADYLLCYCQNRRDWQQGYIHLFNKTIKEPRQSLFFAEAGQQYRYSGRTLTPQPYDAVLQKLADRLQQQTQLAFNSIFINYYQDGAHYMGWHQDNEPELGEQPNIASLSIGASRRFSFRNKQQPKTKRHFQLQHGDLLVMLGDTQKYWQHALLKDKQCDSARFNFTFRLIR